jgi:hypothetical protein
MIAEVLERYALALQQIADGDYQNPVRVWDEAGTHDSDCLCERCIAHRALKRPGPVTR